MNPTSEQITQIVLALRIGAGVVLAVGLLLIPLGIWRIAIERGWIGGAERAVGTVIDLVPTAKGGRKLVPVVRFYNQKGERLDIRSASRAPDLRPGDIADIVHIPDGDTWIRPALFRLGCGPLTVVFGGAMVAAGVYVFRWLAV